MSWINIKKSAFLVISIIHFIILALSFLTEPGSKAVLLASTITALLVIPVLANIAFHPRYRSVQFRFSTLTP